MSAADPFPDSRAFAGLLAEEGNRPPLGSLAEAGSEAVNLTGTPGYRYMGLTDVWLLAIMPDGSLCEGTGPTTEDAMTDARRRWRDGKRGHAGPLAVDGREYQRRLRNRRRRR